MSEFKEKSFEIDMTNGPLLGKLLRFSIFENLPFFR